MTARESVIHPRLRSTIMSPLIVPVISTRAAPGVESAPGRVSSPSMEMYAISRLRESESNLKVVLSDAGLTTPPWPSIGTVTSFVQRSPTCTADVGRVAGICAMSDRSSEVIAPGSETICDDPSGNTRISARVPWSACRARSRASVELPEPPETVTESVTATTRDEAESDAMTIARAMIDIAVVIEIVESRLPTRVVPIISTICSSWS
jgi:hypothetical protein